jgi:Na+/proline symporter
MGGVLIIYTVSGGARAVAYTQQLQFVIIFIGMALTAYMVVHLLPGGIDFIDTLKVSGRLGKLNVITTGLTDSGFNWSDKYNIWSGIIGGFFLQLSYFGTDQSQVGRYLTAKSVSESRIGLLLNGLVKVPMQFLILMVGALVFTFYQFNQAPLFFNATQVEKVESSSFKDSLHQIQRQYTSTSTQKKLLVDQFVGDYKSGRDTEASASALRKVNQETEQLRADFKDILKKADVKGDSNDTNYIFLRFVVDYMPKGLVGLLIAVIFLASWGSIAAALNSLSSSTVVDIHKKFVNVDCTEAQDYSISRWYTFAWGIFSIIIAQFAVNMGSLIEAVNVLGSLFYGVILGIFLVAFYMKQIRGNAVFISAVIVETIIILSFIWPWLTEKAPVIIHSLPGFLQQFMEGLSNISFLWLNAIGAIGMIAMSYLLQFLFQKKQVVNG